MRRLHVQLVFTGGGDDGDESTADGGRGPLDMLLDTRRLETRDFGLAACPDKSRA